MLYVSFFMVVVLVVGLDSAPIDVITTTTVKPTEITEETTDEPTTTTESSTGLSIDIDADSAYKLLTLLDKILPQGNAIDSEKDLLDTWEAPYEIRKNYAYYLAGYDEEGRPMWALELGHWNLKKIVEAGGSMLEDFNMYIKQMAYQMVKSLDEKSTSDHKVTEILFLVDFDGLDLQQLSSLPTVSYILNLVQEYRDLIAKNLGFTVIVNADFVAESVINIVRPLFGDLLERVEVYGTNKAKWIPKVLQKFPKNQLPSWYGGNDSNYQPIKVYG